MEDPAGLGDEEVVEVSVAHAEHVRHNTIGRWSREGTMKVRHELLSGFLSISLPASASKFNSPVKAT